MGGGKDQMRKFLFYTTYMVPLVILSLIWLLGVTIWGGIESYYDWVMRDYEN
jgi:hypothetical protein